jgi:hypothetical protein
MANKYWNGTGNWNSASRWFLDDAHLSGTTVPNSSDDVFFTVNSVGVCTVTTNSLCNSLDMTGFLGSWTGTGGLTIYNSAIFSGSTLHTGTITFSAVSLLTPLTFNNLSLPSVTFNTVTGGWVLQDKLTLQTNKILSFTGGNLNTNNVTITTAGFTSTSGTRTLKLGSSNIYCSTQWNFVSTNLTFSGDTSTIYLNGTTGLFTGAGLTYNKVYCNGPLITLTINGNNTFSEFTIQPTAISQYLFCSCSGNQIINSSLILSGSTPQNRILLTSSVDGTPRTFTNNGSLSMADIDFIDIIGSGTTSWIGTRIGDGYGNSGITFNAPRTLYWVGVSGGTWSNINNWSLSNGGTGGEDLPRPQDDVIFTIQSILLTSRTITVDCGILGKSITFQEFNKNPTLDLNLSIALNFFGDFYLCTGLTISLGNPSFYWRGRSTCSFTTANNNLSITHNLDCYGGTYTLMDNFNSQGASMTINSGTLNTNSKDLKVISLTALSTSSLILGSSNIYLYSTISNIWSVDSTISLTAGSSIIKHAASSISGNITFTGGGKIYNILWLSKSTTATYSITIINSNFFNELRLTPEVSGTTTTIKFTDTTTQTVTGLTAIGSASGLIKMQGTSTGIWTKTSSSSTKNCCNYIDLSGSTANPSNVFYAGVNSIDRGKNVRWLFTSCTQIKAVLQVLYTSETSKVIGFTQAQISKIIGLS